MAFDLNDWQVATQDNLTFAPTLQENQQVVDIADTSTVQTIQTKGLNVLSEKIGFYDGANWRSYIAANGTFYFSNEDQSSYLKYDGTDFEFNGKVSFSNTDMTDYENDNVDVPSADDIVTDINGGTTATVNGGRITANSITATQIAANTITANEITTTSLSALSANMGTVTAGRIQNTGNTNYVNMNATGTQPFIKVNDSVEIDADGNGEFGGDIKIGGTLKNGSLYKTGFMQDRGTVSGSGSVSFTDFSRTLSGFFLPNSYYIILDVQAQVFSYNMGSTNTINSRLYYNNVQIAQLNQSVGGSSGEVRSSWYSVDIEDIASGYNAKGLFNTSSVTSVVQKLSASGYKSTGGTGYLGSRWRIIVLRQDVDNFQSGGWGLNIWEA